MSAISSFVSLFIFLIVICCQCKSENNFDKNSVGLLAFQDTKINQLKIWVKNVKNFKLPKKCFTVKKKKKNTTISTKNKSILQIVDCSNIESITDEVKKFVVKDRIVGGKQINTNFWKLSVCI
jgi:hypothetical protein